MVTNPLGALAAFGAVLVTAAVVVVLAGLPVRRPRVAASGLQPGPDVMTRRHRRRYTAVADLRTSESDGR
jgi:hypothetical protein